MTKRGGAINVFYRILAPPPPNAPLPSTSQYLTILMTEKEGEPVSFERFWRPKIPRFPDIIILERKPYIKHQSISPNDFMFKITNISLALLCHGKPINRLKLML